MTKVIRQIHQVAARGGAVTEFRSCCGGLPAPEANDNPWGYKFSWSPRGVVLAGRNTARYLLDGKVVEIPGPNLFTDVTDAEVPGAGKLEIYPNRDSTQYRELYGLSTARTVFRGTFRYPGHCRTWKALVDMGWLSLDEHDFSGKTYGQVQAALVGSKTPADPRADVAAFLKTDRSANLLDRMEWLGLFGSDPVPEKTSTHLDVLANRLEAKLVYAPRERDMIVLQHRFLAEYPGRKPERITASLVDFGIPGGDSAMARTVSLPAAIATRLILQGRMPATGVHIPVTPDIYEPVLHELEAMGITFTETTE